MCYNRRVHILLLLVKLYEFILRYVCEFIYIFIEIKEFCAIRIIVLCIKLMILTGYVPTYRGTNYDKLLDFIVNSINFFGEQIIVT
jgi:hypothetical protein